MLVLLMVAFSLLGTVGCGKKETAEPSLEETATETAADDNGAVAEEGVSGDAAGEGGSVTFDENNNSAATGEGGGTVSPEPVTTAPDDSELGVPVYPGAALDPDNSAAINAGNSPAPADVIIASYTTGDSLSEVTEFYRNRLGEPMDTTATSADWWQGDMASGSYTVVHIELKSGTVNINIVHSTATTR